MPPPDEEHPLDVSEQLQRRARLLAAQLERDMQSALHALGAEAMRAYMRHAPRQLPDTDARRQKLLERILEAIGIRTWLRRHLDPILKNHAARTVLDTQRTLSTEITHELMASAVPQLQDLRIELHVGPEETARIMGGAGKDMRLPDIEPQARAAIRQAIEDGYRRGENPVATARRIRQYVPAGRFVHAGSAYRSKLIARSETMDLQRAATLAAYDSSDTVTSLLIRDGLLPDSDDDCKARNGRIVPKSEGASIQALHPQCTLNFSPVVSLAPVREPELVGVA